MKHDLTNNIFLKKNVKYIHKNKSVIYYYDSSFF